MVRAGTILALAALVSVPQEADAGTGTDREALLTILSGLISPDAETRIQAAGRAGRTHHPIFLDPLRGLLSAREIGVRAAAATALGELGVPNTSQDLIVLIGALDVATRDSSDTVAGSALEALGRYPFPAVRRWLIQHAHDQKLSPVRRKVAQRALAMKDDREARRRLERYLEVTLMEAELPTSAGAAVNNPKLRLGVEPGSILWAAHALVAPETKNHEAAARVLAEWSDQARSRPFLQRALAGKEVDVRRIAAKGLARQDGAEIVEILSWALSDPDLEVRRAAIAGLARAGTEAVALQLAAWLPKEPNPGLRRDLITTLQALPPAAVVLGLERWPSAVPAPVRRAGVEVASAVEGTGATRLLVRALAEARDAEVARLARRHLDARPTREVLAPLVGALGRAEPGTVEHRRVLSALASREGDAVTEALLSAVEAGRGDRSLLELLAGRPEEVVRPRLLSALRSEDVKVRKLALSGIAPYEGEDVVESLVGLLDLHPREEGAFSLLEKQPPDLTLAPMLGFLASDAHAHHHRRILRSIAGMNDPRIPEPVARAAITQPALAPQALAILKGQPSASARPALISLAETEAIPADQRAEAVEALGSYHRGAVEEPLKRLAGDDELDVRRAARNTLHELAPNVYPSWDPYGRIPLVVEGAGFGAALMVVAADLADADLSPLFTGGVGLVLGGATPFLLTLSEDVTLGDAGYFGTVGLWGTLGGWGLGRTLGLTDQETRWLTIGGEVLGVGTAAATMKWAEWGLDDFAFANVSILEASLATSGVWALAAEGGTDRLSDAALAGALGGAVATVPIALLTRRLQVEEDIGLLATTMMHGAWLGLWVPGLIPDVGFDGKKGAAGAVVGQSVGYLAGLVWAQFGELRLRTAAFSGMGAAIGSAGLGGLGLVLADHRSPETYALLAGGSAAGALALGILEPYFSFGENDAAVIAISTAGGALAGADLSVRIEEKRFDEPSFPGGILLGAGLGAATGLAISQLTDVSDAELWRTIGGTAVFALGGTGFGLMMPDLDVRTRSRVSGAAIAAGLALTYPFAEKLDLRGPNVAYAGLAATTFGLWGSFLPAYWHDEGASISAGKRGGAAMMSASVGMASGLALVQGIELSGGDVLMSGVGAFTGSGIGAGLGLLVPSFGEDTTIGLMQGVGLAGLATMTGLLAGDVVKPRGRAVSGGQIATHTALLAAQGAWQGALIPFVWRSDRPPAEEIAGGVMLGTSVGALAGLTAIHLLDEPLRSVDLVEATVLGGLANGIGGGIALAAGDRRVGVGLMQGLGLAGYTGALFLAPRTDYAGGTVTLLSAPPIFGWFGWWLPYLFDEQPPELRTRAGGLLSAASVGALAGAAFVQLREEREEAELWAATLAGTGIGAGLGGLFSDRDDRRTVALMEGAGLAALGSAVALSPYTEYGGGDLATLGLATIFGATEGAFLPGLIHDEQGDLARRGSGAALGSGLSLAVAMGVAQFVEPEPADVLETGLLTTAAGAAGGGLALLGAGFSPRSQSLSVQGASLAGLVASAVLAPYTEYGGEEATLAVLTGGIGAWHGLLLASVVADEPTDRQKGGGALLGAGAGTLIGTAVGQLRPLSYGDQLETALMVGAGNAVGGGLSFLLDGVSSKERAGWIDIAGLSALSLGVALSPYTEYSGRDAGLMTAFAGIGAFNGIWLDAYRTEDGPLEGRAVGGGALLGAGAGLLVGGLTSQLVEVSGGDQIHAYLSWAVGSGIGAGIGLLAPKLGRTETVALMEGVGGAGLVAGLTALTYLDYEEGDFALVPLGTVLGGALGLTLPTFIRGDDAEVPASERAGGALLGASLGTAGAAALAQVTDFESGDVAEVGVFSMAGAAVGLGLGLAIPQSGRGTQLGLMDGVTAGGLAAGLLLAPYTEYRSDSYLNLGLGMALGGFAGAFTPVLYTGADIEEVEAAEVGGAGMLGAGVGMGAGLLMDQVLELDGDARENVAIGAAVGAMSGAGVGLLASEDDRVAVGLMNGLMLAGAAGVGATAESFEYDWGDVALGSAYVGYLTWHASGLTLLLDGTDRQAAGAVMSTVGLGALTGMYLTPYIHLDLSDVLMMLAGNVWGTWIGGWGGEVFRTRIENDLEGRRRAGLRLLSTVLGSDVGLAVTGMVVGGLLDVPPTRFAVINLSGLGGMMIGMLSAGFAKGEPLKEGNVIGALSGLILGSVVTSFFDWGGATTWDELLSSEPDAPGPLVARPEVRVAPPKAKAPFTLETWFPSATVQPGADGEEQYLFTVSGVFR